MTDLHPFSGPIPPTVALQPPPLPLVLVQVRFPYIASIPEEHTFAPFQEALRSAYPITRREPSVSLGLSGDDDAGRSAYWKIQDPTGEWVVTLASTFVALETTAYPGSTAFFGRLRDVLEATATHVTPYGVERLGVRYVNRLDDEQDLARLAEYVRPEVLGIAQDQDVSGDVNLLMTHAVGQDGDAVVSARWGLLPEGASTDATLRAVASRSWVLDIDVSAEDVGTFEPARLADRAYEFSRLQYRFFRWATTEALLRRFGGRL